MPDNIPDVRRRGPNKPKLTAKPEVLPPAAPQEAAPIPVATRRKRSSLTTGLKLHAPERPGFVRRFANDKGNRLAELGELGYSFVEDRTIATHGTGTRTNRLAGTQDGGAPLKTYLMETPVELWEQGMREKEEERAAVDLAINQGRDPSGETDPNHSYRPGETRHSSITVDRG